MPDFRDRYPYAKRPRKPYSEGGSVYISMTLAPDQAEMLDQVVEDRRANRSLLLREAVDLYLKIHPPQPRTPDREPAATTAD